MASVKMYRDQSTSPILNVDLISFSVKDRLSLLVIFAKSLLSMGMVDQLKVNADLATCFFL